MHSKKQFTKRLVESTDDDLLEKQKQQVQVQIKSKGGDSIQCNQTSRRQQAKRKRPRASTTSRERHLTLAYSKRAKQMRCSGGRLRLPLTQLQASHLLAEINQQKDSALTATLKSTFAVGKTKLACKTSDEVIACDSQSSPDSTTASTSTFTLSLSYLRQNNTYSVHNRPESSALDSSLPASSDASVSQCCASLSDCQYDQSNAGIRAVVSPRLSTTSSKAFSSTRSLFILPKTLPSTLSMASFSSSSSPSFSQLACQLESAKLSSSVKVATSTSTSLPASSVWTNHQEEQHQEKHASVAKNGRNLSCSCLSANTTNCELTTFTTSTVSSFSLSDAQFAKKYQRVLCCDSEGHQVEQEQPMVEASSLLDSIISDSLLVLHVHCDLQNSSVDKSMSIQKEEVKEEEKLSDETKEDLNSICKYLPTSDQTTAGAVAAAALTRPVDQATSQRYFQGGFRDHQNSCLPPARYQIYTPPPLPSLLKTTATAYKKESVFYTSSPCFSVATIFQQWAGLLILIVLISLLQPNSVE